MSEADGAAQVAAWESKSLREELQGLRERSAELSSALEAGRGREAAAVATAQEGVRPCPSFLGAAVLSVLCCWIVPSILYSYGGGGGLQQTP